MRINPDTANKKVHYLSLNNRFCPNVHRTALPTILLSEHFCAFSIAPGISLLFIHIFSG